MISTERVKLQTDEEWLQEYESGTPVDPKSTVHLLPPCKPGTQESVAVLIYDHHRTTKQNGKIPSCLVLSFINTCTGEDVSAFFNVDVTKQRGSKQGKGKGEMYRTGERGQFYPKPRSKFRKFWMGVVGKEPTYWANAWKELKPRLKGKVLTADLSTSLRETNEEFVKAENLRLHPESLEESEIYASSPLEPCEKKTLEGNSSTSFIQGVLKESKYIAGKLHNNTLTQTHNNTKPITCPKCSDEGCEWCNH